MFNIQAEVTFRLSCEKKNLPKLWLLNYQSFFGSCVAFMKHNQDLRTDYDFTSLRAERTRTASRREVIAKAYFSSRVRKS